MENDHQLRLLYLYQILLRHTDVDHPLSTKALLELMESEHQIKLHRTTIPKYIELLNAGGFEVMELRSREKMYYLGDRLFELPEVKLLIDAVQAASFVTEKKTAELVDKIAALGGSNRAEILKRNIVEFNTTKHSNEHIYYNINALEDGVLSGRKVSFKYFDLDAKGERRLRKDGGRYLVNPVAMVFASDNYYLVCYHDKHKNTANYRIDRMLDVRVTDEPINAAARPAELDVAEHRRQAFYMFGGKSVLVGFDASEELLDTIYDRFGEKLPVSRREGGRVRFSAVVQISDMFYGWCCSFGDKLKVVSPRELVCALKDYITKLGENYQPVPAAPAVPESGEQKRK